MSVVECPSPVSCLLKAWAGRHSLCTALFFGSVAQTLISDLLWEWQCDSCCLSSPSFNGGSVLFSQGMQPGIIEGDFALCISLYHGYELLQQMGVRSLFIYLCGIMDGSKGELSSEASFLFSHCSSINLPPLSC